MANFSAISTRVEKTNNWLEEMNADFGKEELEYSKKKGEDDLEQLEESWNILNKLEHETEDETVRLSAIECKEKLDEAIQKLRDFVREITVSLEYEEKQSFLVNVSTTMIRQAFPSKCKFESISFRIRSCPLRNSNSI